jgi:lipopolysaccharide transport system ATP-binding protein
MTDAAAIEVRGLSKLYHLGERRGGYRTLRETLSRMWRGRSSAAPRETFWALRDVSFDVPHGEAVALIGKNGAGKSTLLKVLSRITTPTEGRAVLRGRVGSLLEVGTGFHGELTGRENIVLNGAILGMRRDEIARQFDEIVAFAEVDEFLDTPVKHYSTGMYLRLAFAVAAHLDTEILLVDEVLAVGDASFQRKCLRKMDEVAGAGRTVVFVSHNMNAVTSLCRRALRIDRGRLVADGPVEDVVGDYLSELARAEYAFDSARHGLRIHRVILRNARGEATTRFEPGDDLIVDVSYEAAARIPRPYFLINVHSFLGPMFGANMLLDGRRPEALEGSGKLLCRFAGLPLLPQTYTVRMGVKTSDGADYIMDVADVASFVVDGVGPDCGFDGELFHRVAGKSAPVILPYSWTLPDGRVEEVSLPGPRKAGERNAARLSTGGRV